jgi:Entner-Doudoroff aldolase
MEPTRFVELFRRERASAILRTTDTAKARRAMDAATRGGFRVCEFTLTIPNAFALIAEFREREELVVGAGTVLTPDDARRAADAGAQFLVSPVVDPETIREAQRLGLAMMPGCATPTEMFAAHQLGAPLQKLFPALPEGHGPMWVRQTLAPLPILRIVPTSGVTAENALAYLDAGAHAVGFVNALFDPRDIAAERWDAIEARARAVLAAVGPSR